MRRGTGKAGCCSRPLATSLVVGLVVASMALATGLTLALSKGASKAYRWDWAGEL